MNSNLHDSNVCDPDGSCGSCGSCGHHFLLCGVRWPLTAVLVLLALFLFAQTLSAFKEYKYVGDAPSSAPTIGVQGMGEVFAKPDMTQFTFTVSEDAKTTGEASQKATDKTNKALALVKAAGVEEKNIKTLSYDVSPKTVFDPYPLPCSAGPNPCPPSTIPRADGYTVSQTIEVKMKDAQKAGTLLTQLAGVGVQEVSGLTFTVENDDAIKAQARDKAIKDAKEKAEVLAKSLGVHIVRIISFSEDGVPMPYAKEMFGAGVASDAAVSAPELPQGQNQYVSNVSITYEVR